MTIPAAPARRGLLYAAAVLVVVAVAFGFLAFGRYRSAHALASAPICSGGRITSSCRELVPGTIAKITINTAGRGPHLYLLRLTGPTAVAGDHRFPTGNGVMAITHEGDPVVGEVWRGSVVAVRDGSVRSLTVDAPRYQDREWFLAAFAIVLFVFGILALFVALFYRRDYRSLTASPVRSSTRRSKVPNPRRP